MANIVMIFSALEGLQAMVVLNQVPVEYDDVVEGRVPPNRIEYMERAAEILSGILRCFINRAEIPGPLGACDRQVVADLVCGPLTVEARLGLAKEGEDILSAIAGLGNPEAHAGLGNPEVPQAHAVSCFRKLLDARHRMATNRMRLNILRGVILTPPATWCGSARSRRKRRFGLD